MSRDADYQRRAQLRARATEKAGLGRKKTVAVGTLKLQPNTDARRVCRHAKVGDIGELDKFPFGANKQILHKCDFDTETGGKAVGNHAALRLRLRVTQEGHRLKWALRAGDGIAESICGGGRVVDLSTLTFAERV
jgi:hypothetical protein